VDITLKQIAITSSVLIAAISFIVYLFKRSVISYIEERSKNVATKKDIAEITRLAEEVKREIEIAKESQIGFQALKREAIIDMFGCLHRIYSYFETSELVYADRSKAETELDQLDKELGLALGKITLFVEEKSEFIEHIKVSNMLFYSLRKHYVGSIDGINNSGNKFFNEQIIKEYGKAMNEHLGKYWKHMEILAPKFRALINGNPIPKP
jgi:hypothetical protein